MAAYSVRRVTGAIGLRAGLVVLLLWTLMPIAVMVFTSFKQGDDIYAVPTTLLPRHWTLQNYLTVLTGSSMPQALLNSALAGVLAAVLTLVLCFGTGYVLARYRFRASRLLTAFVLLGQLVPLTVLLLPIYQAFVAARLLDSVIGVGLAHMVITVPLVTIMVRNQVASIPYEIEEAAMMDGASRLDAITYVVLPVCAPGLAAAGMFAFLQSWHEFLLASVLTTTASARTAPVALTQFATEYSVDWGATMAASTILTLPIVVVFVAMQRYFVTGLTGGAVKG